MIDTMELEQSILGGLLINNPALAEINISRDDFSLEFHSQIFEIMQKKFSDSGTFSIADFSEWSLDKTQNGETGLDYIRSLASSVFGITSTIRDHACQLQEARQKEKLLEMIEIIQNQANQQSYAELTALLQSTLTEGIVSTIKTGQQIKDEILAAMSRPPECYPIGIPALDMAMGGGLYRGYTYGFCGAEKAGKTTLAHTISYNLNKSNCPHLYIALEMGSAQIEQRNMARDIGVNSLSFINNVDKIAHDVVRNPARNNVFYLDAPGANLQEIITGISNSRIRNGCKGFILDYWQLVNGQARGQTEEQFLRTVAQSLANYARKHGLWCILMAQMNQEGKLFGGNGLRKACDQLYMIEQIEGDDYHRWLKMDATRYTLRCNVGSEINPSLKMNIKVGPYFDQA